MTAISFKIFGINEFAARFISALLGVCTILLVYIIGFRISNSHKIGFLSGFIILTTQQFLDLSRKCQLDISFAFFISLSILFFILAIQKSEKFYILLGISTGLAILTKGLPAISIIGIVFFFFILNKDFNFFISSKPYIFLFSMTLILCIWLIPLVSMGEFKNFLNSYFKGQIWVSFAGVEGVKDMNFFEKIQSYLWYIIVLAKKYWPWFPLLILSFYVSLKKLKEKKLLLIIILWIFIMFVGFSLAATKYYRHLAPLYPAFAIFIGVIFGEMIPEKIFKIILNFSLIFLFVMLFATSIFPLYFGKISAPDKTEIKEISPCIKLLTKKAQRISVFKMNYWDAVANFAFYVDRPIKSHETEESFASSLKKGKVYGYLKKEEYEKLSTEFKKKFLPAYETEKYFLITNIRNYRILRKRIFPIFISLFPQ